MTGHDDLIHTTGQTHCPYNECDWWVPVDERSGKPLDTVAPRYLRSESGASGFGRI
jgi:hypothetical protein